MSLDTEKQDSACGTADGSGSMLGTYFAPPERASASLLATQIDVACNHPVTTAVLRSFGGAVVILNQRYFTTKKEQGRGLGTYGMKLIGERYLRGKVSFETSSAGTVFTFSLPCDFFLTPNVIVNLLYKRLTV
jgi:hypothetical protein